MDCLRLPLFGFILVTFTVCKPVRENEALYFIQQINVFQYIWYSLSCHILKNNFVLHLMHLASDFYFLNSTIFSVFFIETHNFALLNVCFPTKSTWFFMLFHNFVHHWRGCNSTCVWSVLYELTLTFLSGVFNRLVCITHHPVLNPVSQALQKRLKL